MLGVDIEREQIADRIRVLGAIQTMSDSAARVRPLFRGTIDRSFQECDQRLPVREIRARYAAGGMAFERNLPITFSQTAA